MSVSGNGASVSSFTVTEIVKDAFAAGANYQGKYLNEFIKAQAAWRSNFPADKLLALTLTYPQLATEKCRVVRVETPIDGIRQNLHRLISLAILKGWESKNS